MALIIVSGAIANKPQNGGEAWVRLSWALGFKQLGHDVLFVEQLDSSNGSNRHVRYFQAVIQAFGLQDQAALIDQKGRRICGVTSAELIAASHQAAALINISGHLEALAIKEPIATKVYVDLDPGFTQFWQQQSILGARLDGHDYYFTVGENIGRPDCTIPTNGLTWRPIKQPVVLDLFPVAESPAPRRFTTVGSWRGGFGPVQVGDKVFGQKVHEFRKFIELPRIVDWPLEVALDIHPAEANDLALLKANGWRLVDPLAVAGDPLRFRQYVQESTAEFSVAQGMYVDTNSGWFSDRTVRYLASGKPALVQDTGFSRHLPVGEGLLSFGDMQEAVNGACDIANNYEQHSRAARYIAERFFDSDRVLGELLEELDVAGAKSSRAPRTSSTRSGALP